MRHLNEQLFIAFECISAIGTSLDLKIMVEHFQKVFARKTGALASIYWRYDEKQHTYTQLTFQGKKAFLSLFKTPSTCMPYPILSLDETKTKNLLHVKIDEDWMIFLFHAPYGEIELIKNMLESFKEKLENAVHGCKNHSEIVEINQKLERLIQEEVAKNREKDQHILQQSRLAQMGEMISMIAHQWRQPLGSIAALAASIKLKNDLKKFDLSSEHGRAEQKEFLNTSVQKIEYYILFLTTTIDDFRNFFKPDQQAKETSLAQAIEKALSILSKSLEEHQIVLHVKITSTTLFSSYETQIVQVLINLLKNAHDVIVERKVAQGKIWIHAYEEKQSEETFFMVEIEDNAGGVKPSIMDKIFDPYFSTKLEKNGTGLGLYMAKTIIEEHCHGSLYVENTQKGAKFTLKIRGEYHAH